jgi:rubrerythrin
MPSEKVENMINVLRGWQGIERKAMNDTAEIMEETASPLIRMIMEIIRHDSLMHHRVQQFLIDSLTKESVTVSREDVAVIWDKIQAHDKAERETIKLAEGLLEKSWDPVHKQLLTYLLSDEKKHDSLLDELSMVKTGMGKASGG